MNGDLGAAVRMMIDERAKTRVAAWQAHQEALAVKAAVKADMKVRRSYGLRRRHAAKLTRNRTA